MPTEGKKIITSSSAAASSSHSGDWLYIAAPPITSVGLRLSDEEIRIAVAHRLGRRACEPHTCVCGKAIDARGLHGLACRRSAPRQQRHSHLNDIIWRSMKRAQIPAVKEPVDLMRQDGNRPDGTTILPWSRGRPLAWDVTVPDTYADAHVVNTAAEKREQQPTMQRPTRTPSTASYPTLMCSFQWPLRQGVPAGTIRR